MALWSACGNCVHTSPRRKRSNSAGENKRLYSSRPLGSDLRQSEGNVGKFYTEVRVVAPLAPSPSGRGLG